MTVHRLDTHPLHLGLGAVASVEPGFSNDMAWYEDYMRRHEGDGVEGRLVMIHAFMESWDAWEMHPKGHEVVLCLSGEMTLHQETPDGTRMTLRLRAQEYAINDPGVWHTVDVSGPASALFITAGLGTRHRPR